MILIQCSCCQDGSECVLYLLSSVLQSSLLDRWWGMSRIILYYLKKICWLLTNSFLFWVRQTKRQKPLSPSQPQLPQYQTIEGVTDRNNRQLGWYYFPTCSNLDSRIERCSNTSSTRWISGERCRRKTEVGYWRIQCVSKEQNVFQSQQHASIAWGSSSC
jgi:hypothetical protein